MAIVYRQDRRSIPAPGIVVLAHIDRPAVDLDVPGTVTIPMDRAP